LKRFLSRVALITGGASGIGRAAAIGFAREGAHAVIVDLNGEQAAAVVEEIRSQGGCASARQADAASEEAISSVVHETVSEFGRLDIAFNNVGFGGAPLPLHEMHVERWDAVMNLCLRGCWLAMKHELRAMMAGAGGVIVNTASMAGVRVTSTAPADYAVAKAGVLHLTRYAAEAYAACNIRVNSVSPGLTATPAVSRTLTIEQQQAHAARSQLFARAALPEEIAASVLFLCSDEAAMITGTNMEVCGGKIGG